MANTKIPVELSSTPGIVDNSNATAITIDSSENVGIGTSSPDYKLHLHDSSQNSYVYMSGGGSLGESYGGFVRGYGVSGSGGNLDLGVHDAGGTGFRTAINVQPQGNAVIFSTAATERMRIDSSGRVGIGTSSPSAPLTVSKSTGYTEVTVASGSQEIDLFTNSTGSTCGLLTASNIPIIFYNNSTERMRIDSSGRVGIAQDTPGDFNAAADDLVIGNSGGDFGITIRTGTSNTGNIFFADGVTGNQQYRGAIQYLHSSDAIIFGTNGGSERMRIDSSGNLLVGTTTVTSVSKLQLTSSNQHFGFVDRAQVSGTGTPAGFFNSAGSEVGRISTTNTATSYTTSSDARLKDVTGKARGLEVINELNPVAYNWKADGKADEGLIAQEVKEIVPNAVSGSDEEMYSMDYSKLVVHLVKGMKEQQAQIEALQSEINELKNS